MQCTISQYVADAFTDTLFKGNQAAVCVLDHELDDELMQLIARENNFSETAFVLKDPEGRGYGLRWFTPGGEIDLCGHATLASAFVLFRYYLGPDDDEVVFSTAGGDLKVRKDGERYEMAFPAYDLKEVPVTSEMEKAFGKRPEKAFLGRDLLCVFKTQEDILDLAPKAEDLLGLPGLGAHASARGLDADCVSRSFFPKLNVYEDPVCGSGHCHIVPYWAKVLGKPEITAYQASERGGTLYCRMEGRTVFMAGSAVLFSKGELMV